MLLNHLKNIKLFVRNLEYLKNIKFEKISQFLDKLISEDYGIVFFALISHFIIVIYF